MGVQLLRELVQEMNTLESARSIAKHRKVASSFRDEMLFPIFSLTCTLLRQIIVQDEQQDFSRFQGFLQISEDFW